MRSNKKKAGAASAEGDRRHSSRRSPAAAARGRPREDRAQARSPAVGEIPIDSIKRFVPRSGRRQPKLPRRLTNKQLGGEMSPGRRQSNSVLAPRALRVVVFVVFLVLSASHFDVRTVVVAAKDLRLVFLALGRLMHQGFLIASVHRPDDE